MPADEPRRVEDDGLARPMTGDRRIHREMILEVANLTMRFGGLTAVSAVSFAASRGEITAVIPEEQFYPAPAALGDSRNIHWARRDEVVLASA